jgi:predicted ATPase
VQASAALSAVPHPSVPATLHASLMARLDRLGPAAKDIAQTGATIGREFGFELLSSVTDLPEPQLRAALDRLTNAGLLFVRGAPPESSYFFKHALVQDAAYGTLLRSRRQPLHGRIAATLEDRFPEIVLAQPALLAQHCVEAGLAEKAVGYWLKAGQQAMDRSAMAEAAAQLRKGLEVLAGLPDGPWSQQQELDLQIALGVALSATVGWSTAEAEKIHGRVRRLAEQLDRPEHLVPLMWGQFAFHLVRSEHRLALAIGERLEQIGEVRNDAAVTFIGRYAIGVVRVELGEFVAARAVLQRCVGHADSAHLAMAVNSFDPYPPMLTWLAVTLASLGYIDQARSLRDEALLEARRLGHVHTLTFVFANQNWINWLTRAPMVNIEESLALTTAHGFPYFLSWARAYHGRSLIALGQAEEGLALVTQGLAEHRAAGAFVNTPVHLSFRAEAYAMLGQHAEGLSCLDEAAQFVETTEERTHEAELHRMRGDLLVAAGDHAAAERYYRQAIAVAEPQSARLFQLRASTSLGRLWCDQGKRTEARDLLGPIYNWFTEGFDAPDLKDAKALLDELA